ncbi:MAG: hypothetical protein HC892_02780 [Saprospiraceae bacterium]|nr:hypothetical protein [Saprospiraceae bacterium]
MRGTFQIVKLFGIPVQVHWTFALLIAWTVYSSYTQGNSVASTIWQSLLVVTLFICVVLHEFGHALTARRFGVKTKDIIVLPIGGLARLDRLPEKPSQEFWVAIAGPLVNIAIGILLFGGWLIFKSFFGTIGWTGRNECHLFCSDADFYECASCCFQFNSRLSDGWGTYFAFFSGFLA